MLFSFRDEQHNLVMDRLSLLSGDVEVGPRTPNRKAPQ